MSNREALLNTHLSVRDALERASEDYEESVKALGYSEEQISAEVSELLSQTVFGGVAYQYRHYSH